ncbi:hypothetical protein PCE1_004858 [Barthelona sp. PCE]
MTHGIVSEPSENIAEVLALTSEIERKSRLKMNEDPIDYIERNKKFSTHNYKPRTSKKMKRKPAKRVPKRESESLTDIIASQTFEDVVSHQKALQRSHRAGKKHFSEPYVTKSTLLRDQHVKRAIRDRQLEKKVKPRIPCQYKNIGPRVQSRRAKRPVARQTE